jgi:hypothetical protein
MGVEQVAASTRTSAENFFPGVAVEWGYNLYLLSHSPDDPALRDSAMQVHIGFDTFCKEYEGTIEERLYLTAIRACANSLARGIQRRKNTLKEDLSIAEEEHNTLVRQLAESQKTSANLKAVWHLLSMAGVVYFLLAFIIPFPQAKERVVEHQILSVILGLVSGYLGGEAKKWLVRRTQQRLTDSWRKNRENALRNYRHGIRPEYEYVIKTAERSYEQTFKRQLPYSILGQAKIIMDLVSPDEDHAEQPKGK